MNTLLWFLLAFLCGSLPFSVWLGWLVLHKDIRLYGDHNPGTTNVFRAGGSLLGVLVLLLDFLKGAVPVGLARWWIGFDQWDMGIIAMAPILGHAFSPFLGFRGGKALAISFGIWCGLTFWQAPLVLGLSLAIFRVTLESDGWPIFPGMIVLLAYLWWGDAPLWMLVIWVFNVMIFIYKHRVEIRKPPRLRIWVRRLFHIYDVHE